MTRYTRADGRPSSYELLCGAVERIEHNGSAVELYREHGTYHVRMHTPTKVQAVWDVFPVSDKGSLSDARCRFAALKRTLLSGSGGMHGTSNARALGA